jgi:hypothetical protein
MDPLEVVFLTDPHELLFPTDTAALDGATLVAGPAPMAAPEGLTPATGATPEGVTSTADPAPAPVAAPRA